MKKIYNHAHIFIWTVFISTTYYNYSNPNQLLEIQDHNAKKQYRIVYNADEFDRMIEEGIEKGIFSEDPVIPKIGRLEYLFRVFGSKLFVAYMNTKYACKYSWRWVTGQSLTPEDLENLNY